MKIVEPMGNSLRIDQMREIQENIQFKPLMGKWQIVIIEQSEKMTEEAANSMLKLLEEPPSYIVLILISTNLYLLPSTIVSRCQLYRFNLLSPDLVKSLLEKMLNISSDKALLYANIANGRVDIAIDLCQKKELEGFRSNIIDLLCGTRGEHIWKISVEKDKINIDKLNIYKNMEKNSLNFSLSRLYLFLEFILIWWRDLLVFKELGDEKRLINVDKLRIIQNESGNISREDIFSRISSVSQAKDSIKKNVNIRLVLENFVNNL
ncbi:MAG: DNA polymerase III subunit tau [bacterium ADurb.Bin363]|nr:MAG: DNA polymerase III subunit tau [bacterium ADurb.Bin363]